MSRHDPMWGFSRRQLMAAGALTALASVNAHGAEPAPPPSKRIKLGIIGCGGRARFIARLMQQHGGYEFHATADYFRDTADKLGDALKVDKSRRFSGLLAYQKLIDSGVDAVAVESIPRFFNEHAMAAVAGGKHVYCAKPVAVDVPGALNFAAAGKLATEKKLVFLVDYQMPNDPINMEIVQRIHDGGLGRIVHLSSIGFTGGRGDPAKGKTTENLLRNGCWTSTVALGGDTICEYSIHIIDAILWIMKKRPVAASGAAITCRPNPRGDRTDSMIVSYEFDDGTLWSHRDQTLSNTEDLILRCTAHGTVANAQLTYWGKSFLRGGPKHHGGGDIASLYDEGAKRNIAAFYQSILDGKCDNPTPARAADGALTAVLGREAACRKTRVTMEDLIKENKKTEFDTTGLKT